MKRGTPRHPKTLLLAATLGIPRYAAVGLLESLWHFGQSYAQAGDVGRYSDEVIAEAVGWEGDASKLVSGLVKAGWADRCRCHRVRIHDWPAHADQTVERWLKANRKGFIKCYDDASSVLAESQHETSRPASDAVAVPSLAKPSRAVVVASATPAPPAKDFPSKRAANVFLRHYPEAEPPGAMFKILRPLVDKHGWEVVEPELDAFLAETPEVKFRSWPKFSEGFGTWANGARAPNGKARERQDGANAMIRGGLSRDGGSLGDGNEGATDAPRSGLVSGDVGGARPQLPEASRLPDRPPVAVRGIRGDPA